MNCRRCNHKTNLEHRYCSNCGEELNRTANNNGFIYAGSNNVNIGLGNNSNQEIYIESLNVSNLIDSKMKHKALEKEGVVYRSGRAILSHEEDGKVYELVKFGICPICSGRVFIYYDERFKKKLGKCENSDDHLYTYDHTINAGVPFVTINFFQYKAN